jgi:very-short-patch-repair endonuclease
VLPPRVRGYRAVFHHHHLAVEVDGWETHGTPTAFVEDRRRDRRLTSRGWRVARFTYDEIFEEPRKVAAELRRLLC